MESYHARLLKHGLQVKILQKVTTTKHKQHDDLPIINQLHSQVDKQARHHRTTNTPSSHSLTPHNSAYLINMDGAITSQEKYYLETLWTTYNIETYYADRWAIPLQQIATFDWHNYSKIYTHLRPSLQVYIIKLLTGWLPVTHNINKMTTSQSTCHSCDKDETIAHLFQCLSRKKWIQLFEKQLSHQLHQIHTPNMAPSR